MIKKRIKKFDLFSIIIGVSIIFLCASNTYKSFQNDTFYAIKVGEVINQYGIDNIDHFSFHDNLSYTYPHWLYDLGIYKLYHQFGFTGLYIFTIILYIILVFIIYLSCKKLSNNRLFSFVYAFFSIAVLDDFCTVRAQQITLIIFPIVAYCLEMFTKNEKIRYAIPIVISSIIIANVHCAVWPFLFVLFLPYIAEYLIIKFNNWRKKKNKRKIFSKDSLHEVFITETDINIKKLIILMLVCFVCGLLTPLGLTPYTYLIKTMMGDTQTYIMEHQPVFLLGSNKLCIYLVCFFLLLVFTKVTIKYREFFMLCGLFYLALSSNRHESLLVVIGGIYVIQFLVRYIEIADFYGTEKVINFFRKKIVFAFSIVLIIGYSCFNYYFNIKSTDYVNEFTYPVKAAKWIKKNLDVKNLRMYNSYNIGSYLIFNDIPVFIDSRADLYTKEFNKMKYSIFDDALNIKADYKKIFKRYKINYILVEKKDVFNKILENRKAYKKIYSDDFYLIYKIV